jgi:hypothetical protein
MASDAAHAPYVGWPHASRSVQYASLSLSGAADSLSSSSLHVCAGRLDRVCRKEVLAMVSERIRTHSAGTSPCIGEPLCNVLRLRRVWAA